MSSPHLGRSRSLVQPQSTDPADVVLKTMFLYPPRLSLEALSKIPHTTNRFEAVWWSWNRTTFRTVSWLWGIHLLTRGWLPGTGAILMECQSRFRSGLEAGLGLAYYCTCGLSLCRPAEKE